MNKEEIKQDIIEFLGENGISYLRDMLKDDRFYLAWGCSLYGNVGMQVRNHITRRWPDILKTFNDDYGKFEDFVTEATLEIL